MTELIARRLSMLAEGTRISLSWPSGMTSCETAAGTVRENNGKDGIAIETADGEEVVLAYSAVCGLRIPKAAAGAVSVLAARTVQGEQAVQAAGLLQTAAEPGQVEASEAAAPQAGENAEQEREEPLSGLTLTTDLSSPSDRELKELFGRLPKKDRKRLNGSYDSFKYGIKCNDSGKMLTASESAARVLLDGYEQGYKWDPSASRFCGALYRRAKKPRADVYLCGKWYWEAAWCACQTGAFTEAGAYAVLALLEPQWRHGEDLLEILKYCSAVTYDVSGVALLWGRNAERMEPEIGHVTEALLRAWKQEAVPGESAAETLERLKGQYPKTAMADAARAVLNGKDEGGAGASSAESAAESDTARHTGWVSRYDSAARTGEVVSGGETRPFRFEDVTGMDLRRKLTEWPGVMDGAQWVEFSVRAGNAVDLVSAKPPLVLARELSEKSMYREAMAQCREAVDSPDGREAMGNLVRYALDWDRVEASPETLTALSETAEFYETHRETYPRDAWYIAMLGQLYFALNDLGAAVEFMRQTLEFPHLSVKLRVTFLAHSMRYCVRYYAVNPDPALMEAVRERSEEWLQLYQNSVLASDMHCRRYYPRILRWKCYAECELDRPEEAEQDYLSLLRQFPYDPHLPDLRESLKAARARTGAGSDSGPAETDGAAERVDAAEDDEDEEDLPLPEPDGEAEPAERPQPETEEHANAAYGTDGEEPSETADTGERDAAPYVDRDGWAALHMTKEDVVSLAEGIRRTEDIPAALVCLKAGSLLNPELLPVYRAVSLAADDPLAAPDYRPGPLMSAAAELDPAYPRLNDRCLAAMFLRSSFAAGREFSYNVRAARDALEVLREYPDLEAAFDLLDRFREETGCGVDLYAGYRNGEENRLREALAETVRQAGELYEKYIASPPRESAHFKRLLETKKLLYAQDGELAEQLRMVMEQDRDALERQKAAFAEKYLSRGGTFSTEDIDMEQVDALIAECWDESLKALQARKSAATLQGNRRNNLRSAVTEIIGAVCRWYEIEERRGSAAGRTEEGEALYGRIAPELSAKLAALCETCGKSAAPEETDALGRLLIADAAAALSARLDGTWRPGQERERYAPLLRSDWILLDERLLPDLSATFCALPDFHIFARVRAYLAEEQPDFPARIAQIYGPDRSHNNYGTAALIEQYLNRTGQADLAALPEDAARFARQSELQAEMRLQEFLENCALSKNYGRILRSDAFCNTLENAAQDWYQESVRSGNYGFFFSLLRHAEAYIRTAAARYGARLTAQLQEMERSRPDLFADNPEAAPAIRAMVEHQNYIAAEDGMHRLSTGGFSPAYPQPEALSVLSDFWTRYDDLYRRTADTSRSLAYLMGIHEASGEAQPIGWIGVGNPAAPEKVEALLSRLGWTNPRAEAVPFEDGGRTEVYRVCRNTDAADGVPSETEKPDTLCGQWADRLYVVCLSGVLDSGRLCEKARALDSLDGNRILLLDCALSAADRHALARDMKQCDCRNDSIVIDRVLAAYLAVTYDPERVNRNLLALSLPFSACLPRAETAAENVPVSPETARNLLTEPLSYLGIALPDGAVLSQILATVNYLPGLILLNARKLAEALREDDYAGYDVKTTPPYVVSETHLRRVLSDEAFMEQVRETVLDTLSGDSRYLPLALLIGWMNSVEPSETGYTPEDVLRYARDMGIVPLNRLDMDAAEMDSLLHALQQLNMVRYIRPDTCVLLSRTFRNTLGTDEELLEKLTRFEEAAE